MRRPLKITCITALIIAAVLAFAWPYIQMEFSGSAHYTEQDKREYNFYTPDILKKIPRITSRYDFDFSNNAGPGTQVNVVKFYGTNDTGKVEQYLSSAGYKKDNCDLGSTCWRKTDPRESIYIDTLKGEKTVVVQVMYDFN